MTSEALFRRFAMECSVRVARAALVDALRPVRRAVKKKDWDEPAVVSMEGEDLKIAFVGGAVSIPAEGCWAGEVRVPAVLFVRLARNLPTGIPAGDPLPVELRDDRLYVGSAWAKCSWQAAFHSEIELPLDVPSADIYKLVLDRLRRGPGE